jgi:hypothetical protein
MPRNRLGSADPEADLFLYAKCLHEAAKMLVANLDLLGAGRSDWGARHVAILYRHVLELHLKGLVLGGGGNFLPPGPGPALIRQTHSLRHLVHVVSKVIKAVGWEQSFTCEGVSNLADFRTVVIELDAIESGSVVLRYAGTGHGGMTGRGGLVFDVRGFARQMDAVIGLLDATVDALAATWDSRGEKTENVTGDNPGPPVQ